MRWCGGTHTHQCGSLQKAGEKEGTEADLVFCFGISLSVSIDSALSTLSECP